MHFQPGPDAPLLARAAVATILVLHIAAGCVAIGSGGVALATRKGGRLHRVGQVRRPGRVAGEHPHRLAPLEEEPDHLAAERAGAPGHQDHDRTPVVSVPAALVPTVWWVKALTSPLVSSTGSR